ncbi:MAG: photosystem reaction center subunit [Rhizobium sp.]|nr:photosystem reaction center subunit [Rhizobium sp.]
MKRILATTALVLILSGGAAYAEMGNYTSQPTDINASQFIGQRIYAAETMPADSVQPGAEKDWADVGEINEVILDRSGQVKAVVLGVGGFLGMGEKAVAVPMTDVKFVKSGEGADDFFLVVNTNKDALAAAPAFVSAQEKAAQQAAAADAAKQADPAAVPTDTATDTTMTAPADATADATAAKPADATADATAEKPADTTTAADTSAAKTDTTTTAADTTAKKPADATTAMDDNAAATDTTTTASTTTGNSTQAMTDENRARLTRPEITREGYAAAQAKEITADKLTGARVYGPKDEDVGEINRIILDNNGQVERVVLDVGGFLGIGERQIAVTMDELNIVKNAKGDDFRVYIDANQANLKAQPEFKG